MREKKNISVLLYVLKKALTSILSAGAAISIFCPTAWVSKSSPSPPTTASLQFLIGYDHRHRLCVNDAVPLNQNPDVLRKTLFLFDLRNRNNKVKNIENYNKEFKWNNFFPNRNFATSECVTWRIFHRQSLVKVVRSSIRKYKRAVLLFLFYQLLSWPSFKAVLLFTLNSERQASTYWKHDIHMARKHW